MTGYITYEIKCESENRFQSEFSCLISFCHPKCLFICVVHLVLYKSSNPSVKTQMYLFRSLLPYQHH